MSNFNIGKQWRHSISRLYFIVIAALLYSCGEPTDVGEISHATMIYQNNTSVPIKLINYKGGKRFDRIILASKSLTQKVSTIEVPADSTIYISDSVKVIFGNEKYNTFNRAFNSKYNFLDDKNLVTTFPGKNYSEKKYTFTSQDLSAAISCNGNCD
jgi:hypothetical protein